MVGLGVPSRPWTGEPAGPRHPALLTLLGRLDWATTQRIGYQARFDQIWARLAEWATTEPVDFRQVWLQVAWLHPEHRPLAAERLSAVKRWGPGPIEAMGRSQFHDRVTDSTAGDVEALLPWLFDRVVRCLQRPGRTGTRWPPP